MKIGTYLKKRSDSWLELEKLASKLSSDSAKKMTGEQAAEFAQYYRSTCSDLAMANENKLPSQTVRYLHNLVARSHNTMYGSGATAVRGFLDSVFSHTPRRVLNDVCVQIASVLFFGIFALAALFAENEEAFPKFAERVLGNTQIQGLEDMYAEPIGTQVNQEHYIMMSAYYIQHNTSIGLRCFGAGILILPCLYELVMNAVVLGASFGYMARDSSVGGENFMQFVTAHGPFELTAIVLSAAAGLRLGVGLFITHGFTRFDSLRRSAQDSVPIIMSAVALFILAALTEGCISPTNIPYVLKALWAIGSSICMMIYFVILGSIESETADAT